MELEQLKNRLGWLAMVAGILISGRLAQAQPEAEHETILLSDSAGDVLKQRPWLGLHCFPADATLRAHVKLPEGQGLVVGSVAPDSPAAKAGIQTNDILVKAGDQALKDVPDLVTALEQAADKPLQIELVRSGETKTIEVTPGLRDTATPVIEALPPADRGFVDRWIERMPNAVDGFGNRIRLFRAGTPVAAPFPKDLTLNVTKEGDAPAKIVVKKGDEQWETTEDKLGELPESVRGPVEVFLGKMPTVLPDGTTLNIPLPPPAVAPTAPGAPYPAVVPGTSRAAPRARDLEGRVRRQADEAQRRAHELERRLKAEAGPQAERMGKRIEQLERQLAERLEKLDRLIEERTRAVEATPPAKPATPATPPAQPEPAGPALPEPDAT